MRTRDLGHRLDDETWTYPGDPPVSVSPHATRGDDGYRVSALSLGTHAGTHVDAPAHTEPEGATIDDLPVERFRFDARLVDCRDADAGEAIDPDVLPPPDSGTDLYAVATGWDRHWGTDRYADHPYLAPSTARTRADRGVDVGIDAPSVDPTGGGLAAHHALLGNGRVVVENLAGLTDLPGRFGLRAFPLPVGDGDGAPARAVAVVDG